MYIALLASGTRGDVQPMIAFGAALRQAGHTVQVVAGSNFTAWIEAHGLASYPTVDIEALMKSDLGLAWVEGANQRAQLKSMKALTRQLLDRTVQDTIQGTQGADLLIGGFLSEPYLQAISEKHNLPQITVALQPYRATRAGAASILPLFPRATTIFNRWMGMLAEQVVWSVAQETVGVLRATLGLPQHTSSSYRRAVHRIPALYAMSPHVVPPIDDAQVYTTGYWFLDEDAPPPPDLKEFIEAGDPPVYIGFGSMPSSSPAQRVRLIADALAQVGRRGVLARGWSGPAALDLPDHVYLTDSVAHTWLFPRMAALVHHGGAGTTAAGLRAGKPTLIVPHMADQPFWGRRVHELGVGPQPLPRARLTVATLASGLRCLLTDSSISAKAADLGLRIRAERGLDNAVEWLEAFVTQRSVMRRR